MAAARQLNSPQATQSGLQQCLDLSFFGLQRTRLVGPVRGEDAVSAADLLARVAVVVVHLVVKRILIPDRSYRRIWAAEGSRPRYSRMTPESDHLRSP